jgi:hypothetical protein
MSHPRPDETGLGGDKSVMGAVVRGLGAMADD